MPNRRSAILVVNCGSSSLKFAVFGVTEGLARLVWGAASGIGTSQGRLQMSSAQGTVDDHPARMADHATAIEKVDTLLQQQTSRLDLVGIGHRVVHGGPDCDCPQRIDASLLDRLHALVPLAPLHLPHNLAGISAMRTQFPDVPQLACFDTAFHHGLPAVARHTGLPREYAAQGVRRYGFHGLSYEFIVDDLRRRHGPAALDERLIVAHLGNGASMAAIRHGRSVETTMGFSALGGMPMGTRSGDLDPGILLYLAGHDGLDAAEIEELLYRRSGLLGLSGVSADMRELLTHREDTPEAAQAVDFFCHRARHFIGALSAALGGLDRLIFTGGIGANSPAIRAQICAGMGYLGITLEEGRNRTPGPVISAAEGPVRVEAVATDEERMIARHVQRTLTNTQEVT
ncbi:acetate/propionate family kinase [Halomonas sp. IOP_31]|uniref:acetate/propionate family kinase n=1 Tax=Halomonas sp. IOP_31 TaxID=2876584 RepID=UPI001E3EDE14|nr:acetate/propionate family kinase [Halomonas sp. IOP_31]MCD6009370.1 acetate/propionate family kinase [Halomonas sp. IOP_31]